MGYSSDSSEGSDGKKEGGVFCFALFFLHQFCIFCVFLIYKFSIIKLYTLKILRNKHTLTSA